MKFMGEDYYPFRLDYQVQNSPQTFPVKAAVKTLGYQKKHYRNFAEK